MIMSELSLAEEFELRGIPYDILACIFPSLDVHPPIIPSPPPLAQRSPPWQPPVQPPPTLPQASLEEEVHIVEGVSSSPEIIEASSGKGEMELNQDEQ